MTANLNSAILPFVLTNLQGIIPRVIFVFHGDCAAAHPHCRSPPILFCKAQNAEQNRRITMKDIRSQYQQAYRADNSQYTFQRDDGTFQTYVAGENGVTEEWIAMLKKAHREERNLMRRGKSEGERILNYSLDQIKSQRGDKTAILNRSLNDT